jgi:hypothetical protein
MSLIRALTTEDIPAVAALFQRIFRETGTPAPGELQAYLGSHYLDAPVCDPAIPSLVHQSGEGELTGFIGAHALPMRLGERRLRAAICSSIMVKRDASDPTAGARLLRRFLAGPQDLSFSETASPVSAQMWTGLRGVVLPQYSLDWIRVIRPAAFLADLASRRHRALRLLGPLARAVDRRLRGRMRSDALHWSGVPLQWQVKGGVKIVETDQAGFMALLEPLTRQFALRPDWSAEQLPHILAEASRKPGYGEAVFASAHASSGALIGAFIYHSSPGGMGRVLQLLALPGQAGTVVDALIGHAARRGDAGLRGRTQPALLAAMLGRRIAFMQPAATVVHSHDPALVDPFLSSQGFFNGLAGEHWSRLAGGHFD